jgi:glycosyltransferase involved in cell wall biosynthesis
MGLIIPEGLASGLPVVASSSMGASREMLVEGRQGWLAEPGDVESLERKLALALSLSADELRRDEPCCAGNSAWL